MALAQRKFSQDSAASSTFDGSERIVGLQGGTPANRLFTIDQLHTLKSSNVAGLPSASTNARRMIYCTNGDSGLPCIAISDGTNWRIVSLGGIIT